MTTYLLSVLALLLGPAIYAWGRHRPTLRQILDGFVFVTVAGIVCVSIIPDAIRAGGAMAVVFLLLGLGFPVAIERAFHRSLQQAHVFIVVLAAIGLLVHALIDGIALLPASAGGVAGGTASASVFDNPLAVGVILHRLPVGMAIWWSVRPTFGIFAASTTLVLLIAATGVAYFLGAPAVELAAGGPLALFQAFVAGSLVHVVAFGVEHDHAGHGEGADRFVGWGFKSGVLIGLFTLFALPYLH